MAAIELNDMLGPFGNSYPVHIRGQVTLPNSGGNILHVSSTDGSDQNPGNALSPFLTLTKAKNAASSGDTIIVLPGTYNENNLFKDGVNWHFLPGAVIDYAGASSTPLFNTTSAAVTCKVTGNGVFKSLLEGGGILVVGNANSNIYFECCSMEAGDGTAGTGVQVSNGTLTLKVAASVIAHGYDAFIFGGGTSYVDVAEISSTSDADPDANGLEIAGGTVWLTCHRIRSDGTAVNLTGGTAIITAQEILSDGGPGVDIVNSSTLNVRIIGAKIKSTLTNTSAVSITTGGATKTIYFDNPVFIAHSGATNGITANGAQNVLIVGGVLTNKAKHANVTYVGGTETVNALVV